MIKKLKIKFIVTAMVAISALLFLILATINIVNFSRVTADADRVIGLITQTENGFGEPLSAPSGQWQPEGRGRMGPDAPDTQASIRYFTFAFDESGSVREVHFRMSAISRDDAALWAESLKNKTRGWTRSIYRYSVYRKNGETFVTVVDSGRELLPSYRVLWASIIGSVTGLIVSFLVILFLSGKFVKPLLDSDKRQKAFISDASREMKTPLTAIAVDKEVLKERFGENESTRSIDRQVDKLFGLTLKLNELLVYERGQVEKEKFDLSSEIRDAVGEFKEIAEKKGLSVESDLEDKVELSGDRSLISKALRESLDNAVKFGKTFVRCCLKKTDDRIIISFANDADGLPENLRGGEYDRVFERFFKGAPNGEGKGLGLSIVKEIVLLHGGRVKATVKNDLFTLKVEL